MDPKSKEFKELQAKWYGKLKTSGFDDIEQDEFRLNTWASHQFKRDYNETLRAAKEDYYRMAGHFLHEHVFKTKLDLTIWEMHCDGTGVRGIARALVRKGYKTTKTAVHQRLQGLVKQMLRKYDVSGHGPENA